LLPFNKIGGAFVRLNPKPELPSSVSLSEVEKGVFIVERRHGLHWFRDTAPFLVCNRPSAGRAPAGSRGRPAGCVVRGVPATRALGAWSGETRSDRGSFRESCGRSQRGPVGRARRGPRRRAPSHGLFQWHRPRRCTAAPERPRMAGRRRTVLPGRHIALRRRPCEPGPRCPRRASGPRARSPAHPAGRDCLFVHCEARRGG